MPQHYRTNAARQIPNYIGIYALCDLDNVPIYVGQSNDGLRKRVRRHITSARSDVIANRQIDVWEIAYIRCWQVATGDQLDSLEAHIYHFYNAQSPLMNGSIPPRPEDMDQFVLPEFSSVRIMSEDEIVNRRRADLRLPRQAASFSELLNYYLVVKSNDNLKLSLQAHFSRLQRHFTELLQSGEVTEEDQFQDED